MGGSIADYCTQKDAISDSTRDLLLRKRLLHLKEFNQKQINKLAFFVIDRDPCTGKEACYYLRKAPMLADGLGIGNNEFQAVLDRQYASRISNQAPWKRLMYNLNTFTLLLI